LKEASYFFYISSDQPLWLLGTTLVFM